MPLLTLTTNCVIADKARICSELSQHAAAMLGKPESYVMVLVRDQQTMSFAGNDDPAALLELKSLGLPELQTAVYSEQLCNLVSQQLPVPASRIYIEFSSPERHMWGWDKRTFG